ncbi:MAG: YhdP family protein [Pseudomonadota bacterium]|uniref:YhdP family protein n=1 Tax=Alteromonas macleodii TaxID=28108 RepID=UPI00066C4EBE|nr:YhdP family protein [Alteromonas macleodii]MEC8966466.1 YhdP family protein [Pseudomonadota bacterium]CAI3926811.1 TIGR02099 family protein [Alteromonas macleodii]VTP50216.1 TIGR02099 family protein [Alteromonas macleodii]
MTNFSSVAAYLLKKFWLLLAVLLVLFALVLSAARYALPHIEHNKHLLENYINEQYGVNLSIQSVHAVWQRNGPSIVLNSVSLAKNDASPVALDIRQIYVELDFWESLRHQLISSTRFELRGLKLDIDADRLSGGDKNNFPVVNALERLFLEQLQSFSLEDGVVSVTHLNETNSFDIESLSWNNHEERHQGLGQLKVADLAANSASFIIDITGTREDFDGVFYAKAEELDISPWVSDLIKTKRPLAQSRANFEVWTNFSQSEVTSVQAELSESLLEWGSGRAKTVTGIRGGSLQALPNDENRQGGWNVRVDQLVLNSSNETLTTDLIGSISANGDALINTVKPVQINPFLLLLPLFMDDTSEEEIRGLNPKGELATLQIQWHNGQPSLAAKVLDLQWDKTDKVPGLSSLDADFFWYKNNGAIYLESADSLLSANGVIKKDVNIKLFKSQFYIYPEQIDSEDKQWVVKGSDMLFDSDAVTLRPQFKLNTSTGFMSLYVDVSPLALNEVSSLFPSSLMGTNTDKYLTRAFTGEGEIANARVLWHGRTSDFPFDDNTGIFQAYVDIEQGDFLFAPDWPALNNLDLSLYFVNNALVMESPSATLAGMKISDMSAAIPSFSPDARLIIYANGTGTGDALTALMMDSSLKKSLGKVLNEDVQIGGPLTADIKLDIPFKGKDVVASGTAHLSNNPVFVATTNMLFDKASGEVSFVNGDIDASGLQAQFLKQPVNLSLSGRQGDTYDLNVELGGRWHVHPLANYVNTDLTEYIDGESDWNTTVQLSLSNSGFNYTANLTADLTATQSVLPAPFDTPAGSSLPLLITSKGDSKASNVEASLGDNIRFDGVLPHKEMQFSRAHLALGESDIANIGTGFSISANLAQADVQEWFTTINMLLSGKGKDTSTAVAKANAHSSIQSNESKKANLFGTPSRIFAKADKLNFAGHSIKDAQLSATERNKDWILDLASPQARATIRINSDLDEQGIEINADYLSLEKPVEAGGTTKADSESGVELATNSAMPNEEGESPYNIDPNTLPPIYFYCQSCGVHGIDLGEITLDIAKEENGLAIRQLLVKSDETNVTATGYWKHMGGEIQSALNGTLTSPDVGQMLKEYGVESGIKDSSANVAFDITWPNAPMDFGFEQLNGNVQWSLSDGYLTELSDKGSRIFTLFSLNSLVRKLSLDFRDVFAKGFFYDDMGGTLSIVDGKAYTDDTEIDGGAGEIEITGFTDLNTGGLNYNVSFAPNVTGNLPFLVYFLATPPTALAALAIDQVLTSAKVISNVNYRVTGTIKDPKFDEVERNSKDISLPAQNAPVPANPQDRPLTEDDVRRLKMEVIDG